MKKQRKKAQVFLDIILPSLMLDPNMPTDKEAEALYSMWNGTPKGETVFCYKDNSMVNAWKAKGLVEGVSSQLILTPKGERVIVDMVTCEPNQFDKNASHPHYSTILANRKKKTEDIKSQRNKSAFNLRKRRDKK